MKTLRAKLSATIAILEKFVARPYVGISSLENWPDVKQLSELTGAICDMGRELGIKKFEMEDMSSVIERIDHRYRPHGL